jgi:AcrR family transcriptional regulator
MPNRNDPRAIRTRRLIQDAFLELTKTRNFEDITIADIAEKATVNRATFYAHFQDKYALLEAVVTERIQGYLMKNLEGKKGLGQENLRALIYAVCDYHDGLSVRCRAVHKLFAQLVESEIRKAVLKMYPDEQGDGRFGVLADMLSCSIYGAVNHSYMTAGLLNREELASEMLPFLAAGLSAILGEAKGSI